MKKLIIFGLGDMARMAHYYFSESDDYKVSAFTVDRDFIQEGTYLGLPVIAFEEIETSHSPDQYMMYVAVGYSKMNRNRAEKYYAAKEKGYALATYIHPKATVLTEDIGDNTFIFEDNTVQPFTKIGNNVILWSGNHVGHDSIIKDHVFVSSHVVLSGRTVVGEYSFLGVNATVVNEISIAAHCFIGAGALITKNTVERGVYTTKPADLSSITSDKIRGF